MQYAALKITMSPYLLRRSGSSQCRECWGCAWTGTLTGSQCGLEEYPFQEGEQVDGGAFKHLTHWPWVCTVWDGYQSPHLLLQAHFTSWRQNPPPNLQLVKEISFVSIWWERVYPVLTREPGVPLTAKLWVPNSLVKLKRLCSLLHRKTLRSER